MTIPLQHYFQTLRQEGFPDLRRGVFEIFGSQIFFCGKGVSFDPVPPIILFREISALG
jgi:hypothetical protein